MELKTKFNLDQEVYFIHENKVIKGNILTINTKSISKGFNMGYVYKEIYIVDIPGTNNKIEKDSIETFATKEELLKSL